MDAFFLTLEQAKARKADIEREILSIPLEDIVHSENAMDVMTRLVDECKKVELIIVTETTKHFLIQEGGK